MSRVGHLRFGSFRFRGPGYITPIALSTEGGL